MQVLKSHGGFDQSNEWHITLIPMPHHDSAWLRLYHSQNDRAFNVATFNQILGVGFNELWNLSPIPHTDVTNSASPQAYHRSLDAVGALGLILHFLGSTMIKTRFSCSYLQLVLNILILDWKSSSSPCLTLARWLSVGLKEIILRS